MPLDHLTIAIVDPDPAIVDAITTLLETYDIKVAVFSDGKSFLDANPAIHFAANFIMIEALLPDMNAQLLLREIRSRGSHTPVIILSNGVDIEMRRQAIEFGATDVIEKSLIRDFLVGR